MCSKFSLLTDIADSPACPEQEDELEATGPPIGLLHDSDSDSSLSVSVSFSCLHWRLHRRRVGDGTTSLLSGSRYDFRFLLDIFFRRPRSGR